MIPLGAVPWKAIGAGALVLAIILAAIGLVNYGQKLGKAQAEIERLEGEVKEATAWKDDVLGRLSSLDSSIESNTLAVDGAFAGYQEALLQPPHIVTSWREVAADVPTTIQLGDCDRAATNAWDVLKASGLIGEKTWHDSSYPLSPPDWHSRLELARLRRDSQALNFNLYLSSYPSPHLSGSVGTYQLSTSPLSLVNQ